MTDSITRLHIAPLSPALLDSVLAPSIRPLATDISFHVLPTFPENNYGFVSLPSMEADKLKKKLNGSILKGKKLSVEPARADPSKKKASVEDGAAEKTPATKPKKSSKRKAEDSVLDGYELPAERQVKRGWTEPASAKKAKKQTKAEKEAKTAKPQSKSKYTEKAECLFRTKTPPNKTPDTAAKKNAKSKKPKAPNDVLVHEFSQTISHPSFLKSTTGGKPTTAGFEEGRGWVDEDGNVQESIDGKKTRTADYHPGKKDGAKERVVVKKSPSLAASENDEDSDWTSSSGPSDSESSDSESDTDSDSGSEASSSDASSVSRPEKNDSIPDEAKKAAVGIDAEEASAEASAEDSSEDSKGDSEEDSEEDSDDSDDSDDIDDSSEADSEAQLPAPQAAPDDKEVHPLEALFKRPGPSEKLSLDTSKTFSFFGVHHEMGDEEEAPLAPLTPYTKQDRQVRGLRSGAPTPDTAVFPRHKHLAQSDEDEDVDVDMDDADGYAHQAPEATPSKVQSQPEESDFVKWFWEHRGENNRAWKRRRREAAKDKRQRENRRKGLKGRG